MFDKTYTGMNDRLEPSQQLLHATLSQMQEKRSLQEKGQKLFKSKLQKARSPKRVLTVALAVILVCALSLSAVAAAVPSFREMLFGKAETPEAPMANVGSQIAEIKNVVAEHDGFQMEILGASRDKEALAVYFTLTDTSGQNRLGMDTFLAPMTGQFIKLQEKEIKDNRGIDSFYTCDTLDFNAETNTILCRYVLDTQNAGGIDLSSVDLSIALLELGHERVNYQPVSISESDFTSETMDLNGRKILVPRETPIPIEGTGQVSISAIGVVDGDIHVQLKFDRQGEYFGANFDFVDKVIAPEELVDGYTISFERREAEAYAARTGGENMYEGELQARAINSDQQRFKLVNGAPVSTDSGDESSVTLCDYSEYTYTISPEELSYYNTYVSWGGNSQAFYYGTWDKDDQYSSSFSATFQVEDKAEATPKEASNLQVEGGSIEKLTLSGLGLTLQANRNLAEQAKITAQAEGSAITFSKTIISGVPVSDSIVSADVYDGPVTVKYLADRPIDLQKITSLTINGTEVSLT